MHLLLRNFPAKVFEKYETYKEENLFPSTSAAQAHCALEDGSIETGIQ